jgi:cytochrome c oxidase cbb3-type subunit 2
MFQIDLKAFGNEPLALSTVTVVLPSAETIGLVKYLQKLGTSRGAWREVFEPHLVNISVINVSPREDLLGLGRKVYKTRCVGCHGSNGDGNGPAATFLFPRPRDFTLGVFKFRTTPSGSLPTDGDLYRTLTRGVRWTAMPTWHELPGQERLAVITFIKTFSNRWKEEKPEPAAVIGDAPRATPALIARGRDLYQKAKCFQCHGESGKGDGESAAELMDDLKFPIRPTDLTRGQLKGGSTARDVYRAMTLGLDGTPMPSFADTLSDEERWAISYYVLALSAWRDPLTGQPLDVPAGARAMLNTPEVAADGPQSALDPARLERTAREGRGTPRIFYRGVRE